MYVWVGVGSTGFRDIATINRDFPGFYTIFSASISRLSLRCHDHAVRDDTQEVYTQIELAYKFI